MEIACIIVTYNRIELLKRCINYIENQTYKDFDIIVINNGSTDNTFNWLKTRSNIITINQSNLGGAGGFYAGMKYAYDNDYDWMWMMDDDGVADKNQLKELLENSISNNLDYSNALVCNIDNPEKLSFGLYFKTAINFAAEAKLYNLIPNTVNPFNGTFLSRKMVDKIGFIKKEMFIYGDEMDYTLRAQEQGFIPTTVTTAIHYHPQVRSQLVQFLPFLKRKIDIVQKDKLKYSIKNQGFVYKRYFKTKKVFFFGLKYFIYYLLHFKLFELFLFLKYYVQGIRNKY